jgi:hypothetical protein
MADRSTRWRFGVPLGLVLLAGCAGLAVVLANARGGDLLAGFREEYAGGGSCKWRGARGNAFHGILLFGLLGFPLSLAGVAGFVWEARRPGRARAWAWLGAAVGLAVFCGLLGLGFVGPALELCP